MEIIRMNFFSIKFCSHTVADVMEGCVGGGVTKVIKVPET